MIYIEIGKENVITKRHSAPFDPKIGLGLTKEELDKTGVFVETFPEPDMIVGKRAIPKYNADTKEIYYDYETIPLSDKERLNNIEGMLNEMILNRMLV